MTTRITLLFLIASICCFAQHWEIGGSAGASFLPNVNVTSPAGSATAGFEHGLAFGGFLGQNLYRHISGEIHYAFAQSNLRLASGGTTVTFGGQSHMVHYDVLLHTGGREARTQFFAALGGGLKIFRGTGKESAYQPLSQFGYLTHTQAVKPMASVGAGIKFSVSQHVYLRTEVRDYFTAFPKEIITPAPGAKFGMFLHDIVPMIGISYEY